MKKEKLGSRGKKKGRKRDKKIRSSNERKRRRWEEKSPMERDRERGKKYREIRIKEI